MPQAANFQASLGTLKTLDFFVCFLPSNTKGREASRFCLEVELLLKLKSQIFKTWFVSEGNKGWCELWVMQSNDPLSSKSGGVLRNESSESAGTKIFNRSTDVIFDWIEPSESRFAQLMSVWKHYKFMANEKLANCAQMCEQDLQH